MALAQPRSQGLSFIPWGMERKGPGSRLARSETTRQGRGRYKKYPRCSGNCGAGGRGLWKTRGKGSRGLWKTRGTESSGMWKTRCLSFSFFNYISPGISGFIFALGSSYYRHLKVTPDPVPRHLDPVPRPCVFHQIPRTAKNMYNSRRQRETRRTKSKH